MEETSGDKKLEIGNKVPSSGNTKKHLHGYDFPDIERKLLASQNARWKTSEPDAANNGRRLALCGGALRASDTRLAPTEVERRPVTLRSDNRSRETGKRNKPDQGGKEG